MRFLECVGLVLFDVAGAGAGGVGATGRIWEGVRGEGVFPEVDGVEGFMELVSMSLAGFWTPVLVLCGG